MAEVLAAIAGRNADHEPEYWVVMTEPDAVDVASGFVPPSVRGRVLGLLDHRRDLERGARRPVRKGGRP